MENTNYRQKGNYKEEEKQYYIRPDGNGPEYAKNEYAFVDYLPEDPEASGVFVSGYEYPEASGVFVSGYAPSAELYDDPYLPGYAENGEVDVKEVNIEEGKDVNTTDNDTKFGITPGNTAAKTEELKARGVRGGFNAYVVLRTKKYKRMLKNRKKTNTKYNRLRVNRKYTHKVCRHTNKRRNRRNISKKKKPKRYIITRR